MITGKVLLFVFLCSGLGFHSIAHSSWSLTPLDNVWKYTYGLVGPQGPALMANTVKRGSRVGPLINKTKGYLVSFALGKQSK